MAVSPFDIAKDLNEKTGLEYDIKDYNPYMINRIMSNNMDTIFFANVMNQYWELPKDTQRDFYLHGLPKGRRFGKWQKAEEINNVMQLVMNKYQCNQRVAESYLKCMNEKAIQQLQEEMAQGGRT